MTRTVPVSTLDFWDMSATMRHMITGLAERNIPGPLYVAKNGQQIAVIIRSEAYAPKLDKFTTTRDGDILCDACSGMRFMVGEPYNLDSTVKAANQHWNDTHREPR